MKDAGKTRYEDSWDRYSRDWKHTHDDSASLGVEWGDDTLTTAIHTKYLEPHLTPESMVLEIGPGGGKYSICVAPACKSLLCADVSQKMLNRTLKRTAGMDNVRTLKLDGYDLSGVPDGSIDFAFSIDVFVHLDLEDIYGYLREFRRVLRDGGLTVLHFANFLSREGWDLFVREADFNRAQFKQIGRIGFVTPAIVRKLFEELNFEIQIMDEHISPRDLVVLASKPRLPVDSHRDERCQRIVDRAGGGAVFLDLLTELPGAVKVAPPRYVANAALRIASDTRNVLFAHPPSFVGIPFTMPDGAEFVSAIGVSEEAWDRCSANGIEFRVLIREKQKESCLWERKLSPRQRSEDRGWHDVRVDLGAFAGRPVFLVLETRITDDTNDYNWAGWAEPAILGKDRATGRARV